MRTDPWHIPAPVEADRMDDVERLGLLDTAPETRFDQVTRMARRVLGVPAASISLIDHDRQWVKSVDGLDLVEIPREETVCHATVARAYREPDDPVLILPDAASDPMFNKFPGIGGDGIHFYAGHPLYGPAGHPVGTFCIYDFEPRHLDSDQLEAFTELAEWAQRELERTDEIERAAQIQAQLLPRPLDDLEDYELATICAPAFMVGGDFYDHYRIDGALVLTVADVMGKGLGAAIVSSAVKASVRGASRVIATFVAQGRDLDTGEVTALAADHLSQDFDHTGTFVTAHIAAVDLGTGSVDYTDAGHGLAMIRRADNGVEFLAEGGLPIGVLPRTTWTSGTTHLAPGDMLVIVSDGLLDLLDERSDSAPLQQFVAGHASPGDLVDAARALVADRPPLDDVTVVALRRPRL